MITVQKRIININLGLFGLNAVTSLCWSFNKYNTMIVRVFFAQFTRMQDKK